jgi:LmbE family N-acetylglucosaminyl deacetylase
MDTLVVNAPVPLQSLGISNALRVLVLAPHPDDLDAIGVTVRFLLENGNPLFLAVITGGASGVEDAFDSLSTPEAKAQLREDEQRASCRFLGLPETQLTFLRLEEDGTGQLAETETSFQRVRQEFLSRRPALVFLPHGHDTNLGHQRVYTIFRRVAHEVGYPTVAFLNRDPKTIQMRCDAYLDFDETTAAWKAKLLRFHQSQHQRNLNQRGYGFDERILGMNRRSAEACSVSAPYAEVFELEYYGISEFEDLQGR